jgi:hypothetical protein
LPRPATKRRAASGDPACITPNTGPHSTGIRIDGFPEGVCVGARVIMSRWSSSRRLCSRVHRVGTHREVPRQPGGRGPTERMGPRRTIGRGSRLSSAIGSQQANSHPGLDHNAQSVGGQLVAVTLAQILNFDHVVAFRLPVVICATFNLWRSGRCRAIPPRRPSPRAGCRAKRGRSRLQGRRVRPSECEGSWPSRWAATSSRRRAGASWPGRVAPG